MPKLAVYKTGLSLFLIQMLLFSCIKDDLDKLQDLEWNPEVAFPLVDSKISMDRLIKKFDTEGYLTTDDQDVIVVVYEGSLFKFRADEVFKLNDIAIPLAQYQKIKKVPIKQGPYLLKNIDLDQCWLKIKIEDTVKENMMVSLSMPKTTKNGSSFKETFRVNYKGGAITTFDTVMDISGYNMDLSGDGNERNKLNMYYEAVKVSNGDSVELDRFDVTFQDISFLFLDGYLGKLNLGTHDDSIRINMFDNFKSGTILLEDPKFQLDFINGFGLPIHMTFSNFKGSGGNGASDLDGDWIDNGINVTPPNSSSSPPVISQKTIDNSNSNISEFLAISPSSLNFSVNVEGNSNNDTTAYNFVNNTSEIEGNILLNIPLKGSLDSVIIEDMYNFKHEEIKSLDFATFKLATNNFFPAGIYIQIYFLDKDGNTLDSLIEDNEALFREAATDAEGFSMKPVYEESYFTIGQRRFKPIQDYADFLKIKVMLLTDEAKKKRVKFSSDNYFDFKLGVKAAFNIKK